MAFTNYLKEMDETRFNAIGEFVFDLLFFSIQAHAWHLQTGSYAAHIALNDLYDAIPDLVDDIAEALIASNRKLNCPTKPYTFMQDNSFNIDSVVASMNTFKSKATQMICDDEAGIGNSLADVVSLLDKTIYKLTNLK